MADEDVVESELLQATPRRLGQLRVALDGVDLARDAREDGRRVARPGADLEHAIVGAEPQRLRHQGHDEGLGDRLPASMGRGLSW